MPKTSGGIIEEEEEMKSVSEKEDEVESATATVTTMKKSCCEECKKEQPIYQCPRCNIRTCSLECCRNHKSRLQCNGKRDRSSFLPVCRMDDSTLRNDYFFLEEVMQHKSNAKRIKFDVGGRGSSGAYKFENNNNNKNNISGMSKKQKRLLQQATNRGITLQFMPPVMERHKCNTSWFCVKRDMITWRIDVIVYPQQQQQKLFHFQLSENDDKILNRIQTEGQKLKNNLMKEENILGSSYRLFIKQLPSPAKDPRFKEIYEGDNLRKVLNGMTIVEYPTIYYVPEDHADQFPIGNDKVTELPAATATATAATGSTITTTTGVNA